MTKTKLFYSVSTLLMLLLTSCNGAASSQNTMTVPAITSHVVKKVPVYRSATSVNPDDSIIIHHFNGSSVGYVTFDEIEQICGENLSMFSYSTNGHVVTVTNGIGSCAVDYLTQTMTYTNFDGYAIYDVNDYVPYIDALTKGYKKFFVSNMASSTYDYEENQRVICFKDYSIPLYFEDGIGYFPLEAIVPVVYTVGSFSTHYNGNALYTYEVTSTLEKYTEFMAGRDNIDLDYMEYSYNLFALFLDQKFGLDKKVLTEGNTKVYLPYGAYAALAPYHERMVSLDTNSYDEAMFEFFANELDDGGHSLPSSTSGLIGKGINLVYGDCIQSKWDLQSEFATARDAAGYSPSQVVYTQTGLETSAKNCYQEIDGVAYITFDSFSMASTVPDHIDIHNYFENTTYTVSYANEMIRKHNIKNLVIDLTLNGGGSSAAEQFMASWLCGGVTTAIRNTHDKTFVRGTCYADINYDGVYNEYDALPNDVNVYCMTSGYSFSCGNLLPFHLKEQRKTTFIGQTTGGGSCVVSNKLAGAFGFSCQISGVYQLGNLSSTSYENFTSVEDGVSPDHPLSTEKADIPAYFDRAAIIEKYIKK